MTSLEQSVGFGRVSDSREVGWYLGDAGKRESLSPQLASLWVAHHHHELGERASDGSDLHSPIVREKTLDGMLDGLLLFRPGEYANERDNGHDPQGQHRGTTRLLALGNVTALRRLRLRARRRIASTDPSA